MPPKSNRGEKSAKDTFLGLGIAFASVTLVLGIFFFGAYISRVAKNYLGRSFIKPPRGEEVKTFFGFRTEPKKEEIPDDGLSAGSFGDLFSGSGYINTDETTMHHDQVVTAFTFPPKFEWQEIQSPVPSSQLQAPNCLLSQCLSVRDNALFLNDEQINLPLGVGNKNIRNVSANALGTKWAVGVVVKEDDLYLGSVFTFDGKEFEEIFNPQNTPFKSKYEGVFGFGGEDNDWLAIYGSYETIAYRLNSQFSIPSSQSQANISRFLGLRVMSEGLAPAVTRLSSSGKVHWYIWSRTPDKPKLVKLFQNGGESIVGATDLTNELNLRNFKTVLFAPGSEPNTLLAEADGGVASFKFKDLGFDVDSERVVTSLDIYNNPAHPAEIKKAVVAGADLEEGKGKVKFYLSNDGAVWHEAGINETITFKNESGRILLWRAVFSPGKKPMNSPFFDKINIGYRVKNL